jgi:two-component system, chemotaxis family, chemotaxis protein CheY
MRILLVDDSQTMRSIEKTILSRLGEVEFVEAADGMEALVALASATAPFDLALIDWNMPTLDGGQLVSRIREKDKAMPLIMVTTEAEKTRVIEAVKAGVNGYVIKPFTADVLFGRVQQALAKSALAPDRAPEVTSGGTQA